MFQTSMESVYLLFVVFVVVGHTAPTFEAKILDPIRNMLNLVRSRPQSKQDLDKLFSRFRDNVETLDAIDPTEFDPNNPTITADLDYPQIKIDYYQDQGYSSVGQTLILNKNTESPIKLTSDKPKPPVWCKLKEKKPPPECPKSHTKCPKPPPEYPKKLKEKGTIDPYDSNLNPDLLSNSKLPSDGPFDSEMPSEPLSNAELPSNGPHNSKLPSDPLSNSRLPFDGPYNSKFPSKGPNNSEPPPDVPYDSELPLNRPYNFKLPSIGPYNLNLPSDGPYNSNLPSDRLSSSKILSDGSRILPFGPNISKLPNDDVSNSKCDTDKPNNIINDVHDIYESNNKWLDKNRESLANASKKITQTDYDQIIAQKLPTAVELLEKLRKLNKLKELHKMNEKNEHKNINKNVNNVINENFNKNHNAGNEGNNENSKATPQSPTVKSNNKFSNMDINPLLQSKGVYMRTTTSLVVDDDRPVMRKLIKRRFY